MLGEQQRRTVDRGASTAPSTTGNGSTSTTTASAASTAASYDSATTTATGSPTNRTRSHGEQRPSEQRRGAPPLRGQVQVACRQYGDDARQVGRGRDVDVPDASVRDGAAHEHRVQESVDIEIGDEPRLARQQRRVLDPADLVAQHRPRHREEDKPMQTLRDVLVEVAARGETITYDELRSRLGLTGDIVPARALSEEEDDAGRGCSRRWSCVRTPAARATDGSGSPPSGVVMSRMLTRLGEAERARLTHLHGG